MTGGSVWGVGEVVISGRYKTRLIAFRSQYLSATAKEILEYACDWAQEALGRDLIITETVTTPAEDAALKRTSNSHSTGRAFDVSAAGWNESDIQKLIVALKARYEAVGAISKKTKNTNLVYVHDAGSGIHFHVQVSNEYATPKDVLASMILDQQKNLLG
jgi:hypothetical protein